EVEFIVPPEIDAIPENITACDLDGDGLEIFNLTANGLRMMGNQDTAIYEVTYFTSEADANAFVNPIEDTDSYLADATETIYARISSGKSCYEIASFQIQVQKLDFETSLETSYTLCLDAEGNILEPLPTLDTGLPSSEYRFTWYRETIAPENRIEEATGPSYAASAIGIYHIVLVNLNYGCEFSIATTVSVSQQPESFRVQFLSDLFTNNNVIEIAAEGNSDYLYAVDDQDFGVSNRFENLTSGEHTAYITDVYFCSVQSEEFLVVDFPRFFTPNGDGINDIWQIVGFPEIESSEIAIFDQYGSLLYQYTNDGGWDGTVNNIRMPANDYWFKISYVKDEVQKEFKSHFSLKR
ncbi:MAG TPA: T9SS type B sorting domain-containing protein, partial [Pricia sp.]|nr:T9SS type B sorting domain-containing protein [Pricia sp.]